MCVCVCVCVRRRWQVRCSSQSAVLVTISASNNASGISRWLMRHQRDFHSHTQHRQRPLWYETFSPIRQHANYRHQINRIQINRNRIHNSAMEWTITLSMSYSVSICFPVILHVVISVCGIRCIFYFAGISGRCNNRMWAVMRDKISSLPCDCVRSVYICTWAKCLSVCLSVRPSVKRVHCDKTYNLLQKFLLRIKHPFIQFSDKKNGVWGTTPCSWNSGSNWTCSFENADF